MPGNHLLIDYFCKTDISFMIQMTFFHHASPFSNLCALEKSTFGGFKDD